MSRRTRRGSVPSGALGVGERILQTLWVGSLWSTGFVVAPALFQLLDRAQAGMVAGRLFTLVAWLGLACGLLLLIGAWMRGDGGLAHRWRRRVVAAMLAGTAAGLWLIQPRLAELKASGLLPGSAEAAAFARLHAVSSAVYLVVSLLGLLLVALEGPGRERGGDGDLSGAD